MPVTFPVNGHSAQSVQFVSKTSPRSFATDIRSKVDARVKRHPETQLLASCLNTKALSQTIPTKNGFVDSCITAYNQHHHLIIRPDDIWMAIITQFSFYTGGHAQELQDRIIPRSRRKPVTIKVNGDKWMSDSKWITNSFVGCMKRVLRDKELESWILPRFSTTTKVDALCASIAMMGTLQSHYAYEDMALCGIPTVTLEGERSDYCEIERRLDRLEEFGDETYVWGEMLRPIIRRFIRAFDGQLHTLFWNQICHRAPGMCGEEHYTGWITAFCPFDERGRWQLFIPQIPAHINHLLIDEIQYQALRVDKVPWGFCQLDFKVVDGEKESEASFVAGHLGQRVCNGPLGSQSMLGLEFNEPNTCITPHPAWFIFKKVAYTPGPAHAPAELEGLEQYLRDAKYRPSDLLTGIPVLTVQSAYIPSPIEFSTRSEGSSGSQRGEYSSHKSHPSSPTSSSTGSKEKEPPRRLRKEPPMESPSKDPSSWLFPTRRRPPLISSNSHPSSFSS